MNLNGLQYTFTGIWVQFSSKIQNWKDFCLQINIPKGNGYILRIIMAISFQKHCHILEAFQGTLRN